MIREVIELYKICIVGIEESLFNSEMEKLSNSELKECEFVFLSPNNSLAETISTVLELNPDALISNFTLSNVEYNGNDIIVSTLEQKPFTSCFIVTEEVLESEKDWRINVNIIYDYNELGLVLKSKLLQSIRYQKGRINTYFSELKDFIQKEELTLRQEDRLKEVYSLLLKQFPNDTQLKELDITQYSTFNKKTQSLINQAERLLKELKG